MKSEIIEQLSDFAKSVKEKAEDVNPISYENVASL